jgi:plasmid stabilization system protein ParE
VTLPIGLGPGVGDELWRIARWYESRRPGHGREFLECFRSAAEHAAAFPTSGPTVTPLIRRRPLRRFPYSLFYVVHDGGIVVLSVRHQARRSRDWPL